MYTRHLQIDVPLSLILVGLQVDVTDLISEVIPHFRRLSFVVRRDADADRTLTDGTIFKPVQKLIWQFDRAFMEFVYGIDVRDMNQEQRYWRRGAQNSLWKLGLVEVVLSWRGALSTAEEERFVTGDGIRWKGWLSEKEMVTSRFLRLGQLHWEETNLRSDNGEVICGKRWRMKRREPDARYGLLYPS